MIYHKEDRADFRVTQSQIPISLLSNIIELRTARNRILMVGSFDSPGQKSGLVHKTQNKTPFLALYYYPFWAFLGFSTTCEPWKTH